MRILQTTKENTVKRNFQDIRKQHAMDFTTLIEGPLLWIAFLIFFIGIIVRIALFVFVIIRRAKNEADRLIYSFTAFARALLPFHKSAFKKPLYTALRYIFHISLFVVPIWLLGHVTLLEESWFAWSWTALPDEWADRFTLLILALATYFFVRRITVAELRRRSSTEDYLLILITALPYLTGYFLAHGTLDSLSFIRNNIWTIHVASAEVVLIVAAFLVVRTRLDAIKCIGCAACTLSCPTGTLGFIDRDDVRLFRYSRYQCVCCGLCVKTCPEDAAELRHGISVKGVFQLTSKQEIQSVKLKACRICGKLFAPDFQVDKVSQILPEEHINSCPQCKGANIMNLVHDVTPLSFRESTLSTKRI